MIYKDKWIHLMNHAYKENVVKGEKYNVLIKKTKRKRYLNCFIYRYV